MKLEAIMELWQNDCNINTMELGEEAIKIPKLHSKYYQIFINERLVLKKHEIELKQLRLEKSEFYTQGPTQEQHEKGWELPASGKVLRADASTYVDADKDVVEATLKYSVQKEKVDFLDSIIKSLKDRGWNIKAAIDFEKFKMGV